MKFAVYTVTLLSFALSGCVSLSETEDSLLEQNNLTEFCHTEAFDVSTKKIEERLLDCYSSDATLYNTVGSFTQPRTVIKRLNEDGSIVFNHIENSYYGFRLHIENVDSESCPTSIKAHVMNKFWQPHITRLEQWLSGEELSCSF